MRVFLSWSGTLSKAIATALAEWLPYVVQTAKPWMSEHDIQAGTVWERELAENLKATDCGVLILTSENQNAPWLLFEAGALSRSGNDRVIPYRVDLPLAEVAAPLTRFQGVDADLLGTKKLVAGLNAALPEPMPDKLLDGLFDVFWPKLQPELSKHISSPTRAVARRSQEDYLIEILGVLRNSKTPQSSGQSHEASPAVAIQALESEVESLGNAVTSMEEYERKGGGASLESWWDGYVDRHRQARDLYSEALALVKQAKGIPRTT